jgi:superfamily I DNA/RNA helicase
MTTGKGTTMARFYPSLDQIHRLTVAPTEGEMHLLSFLQKNLDDSYEVFFQPFINGDRPDIVVLRRYSGAMIIEVKDWNIDNYHVDNTGAWLLKSNGTIIRSPISQVMTYKGHIIDLHVAGLLEKVTINPKIFAIVTCAVYFHNASEETLNDLLEGVKCNQYIYLLGRDSLNYKTFNSIIDSAYLSRRSYYFDDEIYNKLKRHLLPPLHTLEQGELITYSRKQAELIVSHPGSQKIKGVAGSGKTRILAQRAVNAHKRTGKRVLILTFNLSLRNYIHDYISKVRAEFDWRSFYITNYHQFFKNEANNYELEIHSIEPFNDYYFFHQVKDSIIRYDSIFVDETQDYEIVWLKIIRDFFLKEGGEFVVFGDEKQNIYRRELEVDKKIKTNITGRWNELQDSYRLSEKVLDLSLKFQEHFLRDRYEIDSAKFFQQRILLDIPQEVNYFYFPEESVSQEIYEFIGELAHTAQIHPNDIGILANKIEMLRELDHIIRDKGDKTETTFESKELYDFVMSKVKNQKGLQMALGKIDDIRRNKKINFWMNPGIIKLSTIYSFKGWEIHTLFLIVDSDDDDFEELVYTGITRCRYNLTIINLKNQKYDLFFRKYGLFSNALSGI